QLVLGGVVVVHRALGHPGALHDVLDGGLGETALGEECAGRREQPGLHRSAVGSGRAARGTDTGRGGRSGRLLGRSGTGTHPDSLPQSDHRYTLAGIPTGRYGGGAATAPRDAATRKGRLAWRTRSRVSMSNGSAPIWSVPVPVCWPARRPRRSSQA